MNNSIIMPAVDDIRHFLSAGQDRSTNNEANQIREDILANIIEVSDEYLNHPEFGTLWTSIREKFISVLNTLCDEPFKKISVKQKGGMSFNYDFVVTFLGQPDPGTIIELTSEGMYKVKADRGIILPRAKYEGGEIIDKRYPSYIIKVIK